MNTRRVIDALGALAHEHRLAIFRLLIERGPAGLPAGRIAEKIGLVPSSLTFHLQNLQRAGLITRGREAQWRPCRLLAEPLKDAADWLDHYREFWEQSLDRLADYLKELQGTEKQSGRGN